MVMKVEYINMRAPGTRHAPTPQTEHAAGVDLYADEPEKIVLRPFGKKRDYYLFHTNIAIRPDRSDVVGLIFPRSGNAINRGLVLRNGTGVIDADYRGEILVALQNTTPFNQVIEPGTRIAQLVFVPFIAPEFVHMGHSNLDEFADTERGAGGFGSTGA